MRAYRTWLRALDSVAPQRAARALARHFCTPVRAQGVPAADVYHATGSVVHDGLRLPIWRGGSGTPVLLVHGWDSHGAFWDPLARALVSHGHRVVTFDLPGHGRAGGRHTHIFEMADAVRSVVAAEGPFRVFVGHSAGASAVALALRAGLEAERAVLMAPPTRPAAFVIPMARALGLSPASGHAALIALGHHIGRDPLEADTAAAVSELRLPGLVVHDRDDRRVAWDHGEAVARAWPGARLMSTRGLGHNGLVRDDGVIGAVIGFVRQGADTRSGRVWRAAG